jgi:hypothetical protein
MSGRAYRATPMRPPRSARATREMPGAGIRADPRLLAAKLGSQLGAPGKLEGQGLPARAKAPISMTALKDERKRTARYRVAVVLVVAASITYALASGSAAARGTATAEPIQAYRLVSPLPGEPQGVGEAGASAEDAGHAKYRLDADKQFNRFSHDAAWIEANVDVIKTYPPFGDFYVQYGKPVIGYHDPATEGYAPLEKPQIEAYVAKVKRDMSVGYAGVFVDDANWSASPSPGPEGNLANLLEAIRQAEPSALIEINSQYHNIWPKMKEGDANVARALAQVNLVTKEFGVGPTAGITTGQDYGEYLSYVDALRGKGIHVVMTGDDRSRSVQTMEFNEATCLLVNDGNDYVNASKPRPRRFAKGFAVNLGSALGQRQRSSTGVWSRQFSGGVVYTVEPGAATQTIALGKKMHSAEWGNVESVTLAPGEGAVLAG